MNLYILQDYISQFDTVSQTLFECFNAGKLYIWITGAELRAAIITCVGRMSYMDNYETPYVREIWFSRTYGNS